MSDLKAAFRAAKEQRSTTAPTPAQIRALKAAKLQQKQPPSTSGKPAQAQQAASRSSPPAPEPTRVLAPPPETKTAAPAPAAPRPGAKPAVGAAPPAPVPEGFFQDKTADAKIRGVKLPDAQDKEAQFEAFQRSIEQDLQEAAIEEAHEAEVQAEEKEEFEDFAQWIRIQRIEEFRQKKRSGNSNTVLGKRQSSAPAEEEDTVPPSSSGLEALDNPGTSMGADATDTADAATVTAEMLGLSTSMPDGLGGIGHLLPKRRRLQDTLAELQAHSSSDDDEDDGDLGPLLDWRAKGV